jgi:hypothetical protein
MATSTDLRIFDPSTWRQLGSMRTSVPFWSAAISNNGEFIYALVPKQHSVLVVDTTSLHEIRAISVGRTPALALVAP